MELQSRVRNILTKPKEEWPVIAAESTDVGTLYRSYIVMLAAIPVVCRFIGMTVIGISVPFFGTMRIGIGTGLSGAIVGYVLSLAGVYVAAVIVERLAPTFQSKGSTIQALKLVAYASTPAWLAGVFSLIPVLGVLAILGALYAIYLFYLGMGPLMQTPQEKVIPYMLVSAVVIVIIYVCVAAITGAILGVGGSMMRF